MAGPTIYWYKLAWHEQRYRAVYFLLYTTCNSQPTAQAREPLLCHEVPTRPWEKIAIDLFEIEVTDYVITEVNQLNTKTSKEVIRKVKSHLAHHNIPDQIISDNGQPFFSAAWQDFAKQYEFEHITSSPGYPQSNGKAAKMPLGTCLQMWPTSCFVGLV